MRLYAPSHDERRYAEADRSSQGDRQQREPRLDKEQHLTIPPGDQFHSKYAPFDPSASV